MQSKILLLFLSLFFSLFLSAQETEKKHKIVEEKTSLGCLHYPQFIQVSIIPGTVEHPDVRPRVLTDDEKCLVEQTRKDDEYVVLQIDTYTEVRIFPRSKMVK